MKRLAVVLLMISLFPVMAEQAAPVSTPESIEVAENARVNRGPARTPTDNDLASALSLAKAGQYAEASLRLFQLSYSPRFASERMQIKYILGLTLHQLKLNQVSAFQFISVIRDGHNKFVKQSLEQLSLAADALGDDTLLNYAVSRINVDEFPKAHRDMVHYRIGEYLLRNKQFEQAAQSFERVDRGAPLFSNAKYQEGLAFAEMGDADRALAAFEQLYQSRQNKPVTDKVRVDALMGKARVLYQKKQWDEAIATYREVPRDTEFWHDTLFESSWAMLRSGRFRSAMSNFQSLHSAFYEDTYLPESILLRAIVYLYICKYDEMDKTLSLFTLLYRPVYKRVDDLLNTVKSSDRYFNMMNHMLKLEQSTDPTVRQKSEIPYVAATKISREADFQNAMSYIRNLIEERRRILSLPNGWANTPLGQYAKKVLATRMAKAKQKVGKIVFAHLFEMREDLADLIEQEGFIRYEMTNGRKESLKKKIAGKNVTDNQIDQDNQRDFYIQNGYEYWPFRGEYWLDELGNYHYVGTQSCN